MHEEKDDEMRILLWTRKQQNLAKGKKVNGDEEEIQDRALGHTWSDSGGLRCVRFKLNELSAAREVGFEPVHGSVGDADGG